MKMIILVHALKSIPLNIIITVYLTGITKYFNCVLHLVLPFVMCDLYYKILFSKTNIRFLKKIRVTYSVLFSIITEIKSKSLMK